MSAPDPRIPPPIDRPPAGSSRYGWFAGVLALLILAYILVNTLRTDGLGAGGLKPGDRLPPFAAPSVLSNLHGDANLATPSNTGTAVGKEPACTVRGPRIVNSCQLGHAHPLVIGFLFTRGARCTSVFDAMQRESRTQPDVRFAGIIVRGSRSDARALVRRQGWTFPIGFDADGGLSNRYGVAVCPELVFAYPGGVVRETGIGEDLARTLDQRVTALLAGARRRGWRPAS